MLSGLSGLRVCGGLSLKMIFYLKQTNKITNRAGRCALNLLLYRLLDTHGTQDTLLSIKQSLCNH